MTDVIERPKSALEHIRSKVGNRLDNRAKVMREVELHHIRTEYDDRIDEELDLILAQIIGGNAAEGHAVFVTGASGAGKSTLVRRRLEAHPALEPYIDAYGNEKQIWLRVSTPPGCTMKGLGVQILQAAGYPMVKPPSETEVWSMVKDMLRRKDYHMIFFDEFQHVLKANTQKGVTHTTDTVKALMQDPSWPVWLFLVGIPETLEVIRRDKDGQMERRSRRINIRDYDDDPNSLGRLAAVVQSFATAAELKVGFPVKTRFLRRLSHAGLNRFGMTIQLTKLAIEAAMNDMDSGDALLVQHFAKGYRRMSDCEDEDNVFIAEDWHKIVREFASDGRLTKTFERTA